MQYLITVSETQLEILEEALSEWIVATEACNEAVDTPLFHESHIQEGRDLLDEVASMNPGSDDDPPDEDALET